MNHKLRVLVRVDVDPAQVTLEITGCVTQSDSAALLHIVRRACRLEPGAAVVIDLHGASHLDPEVLLDLRRLADAGHLPAPDAGGSAEAGPLRFALDEPAVLPICLVHVGADAEVLAGLDTDYRPAPVAVAGNGDSEAAGLLDVGPGSGSDSGLGEANSPLAAETGGASDFGSIDGLALSEYFEGHAGSCGHGPGTVRHGAVPARGRSVPPPRHQQPRLSGRTPGTSLRPKSFRTATCSMTVTRQGTNWRKTRPWPEPGRD